MAMPKGLTQEQIVEWRERQKAYLKSWKKANQEKVKADNRARYIAHAEEYRAQKREYRVAHPEKVRAQQKAYRRTHPERAAAQRRAYRLSHPEQIRAYYRGYRSRYPEKVRGKERFYYATHKEKVTKRQNALYARIYPDNKHARGHTLRALAAGVFIGPVDYAAIRARDKMVCCICGKKVERKYISYDHTIPLAKGGPHIQTNIRVAHRSCNAKKGSTVPNIPVQMILI